MADAQVMMMEILVHTQYKKSTHRIYTKHTQHTNISGMDLAIIYGIVGGAS